MSYIKFNYDRKINRHKSESILSGRRDCKKFSEAFAYLLIRQRARDRCVSDNTVHKHAHTDTSELRCGKRARIGGQTGGIARLSAGGYRRTLGSVAARNARGIHRSNGRTGTS